MKLSKQMRDNLNQVPDEGEHRFFYASQCDPLAKRGLIEWEMKDVVVTIRKPVARLTELGRRIKYQNSDD